MKTGKQLCAFLSLIQKGAARPDLTPTNRLDQLLQYERITQSEATYMKVLLHNNQRAEKEAT